MWSGGIYRVAASSARFHVLEELRWRIWDGVVVDLWSVACEEGAHGHYVSAQHRLFALLELHGAGAFTIRQPGTAEEYSHDRSLTFSYVPAGVAIKGHASGLQRIVHLDIHFDEDALTRRFGRAIERDALTQPRFCFEDAEMASIAKLLAADLPRSPALHELAGGGLLDALVVHLFDTSPALSMVAGACRCPVSSWDWSPST